MKYMLLNLLYGRYYFILFPFNCGCDHLMVPHNSSYVTIPKRSFETCFLTYLGICNTTPLNFPVTLLDLEYPDVKRFPYVYH